MSRGLITWSSTPRDSPSAGSRGAACAYFLLRVLRALPVCAQSLLRSARLTMRSGQPTAGALVRQFTNCRILRGGTLLRSGLHSAGFGLV